MQETKENNKEKENKESKEPVQNKTEPLAVGPAPVETPAKSQPIFSPSKPPLALVRDFQKMERAYSHSVLEGIYRMKIGKRKGLDIWIVDGAKVRRELYTDFLFGGNDQRYKFIPLGEIWIDSAISVEELEFTIIHEIYEREKMMEGMTYGKAHELATQEELKARINKTESIDELRERWYKLQGDAAKEKENKQ